MYFLASHLSITSCFLSIAIPPSFFARENYVNQSQTFTFSPDFSPGVLTHISCWSLHITLNSVFPKQNSSLSPFFSLTKRKKKKKKAKKPAPLFVFPTSVNHTAHLGSRPPLPFTSPCAILLNELHILSSDSTNHHSPGPNLHQHSSSLQTHSS